MLPFLLALAPQGTVPVSLGLRIVAERGAPAPGAGGLAFETFGASGQLLGIIPEGDGIPPRIGSAGEVAFHATLGDGDPVTDDGTRPGIWRELGSGPQLLVEAGVAAPVPNTSFATFPMPAFDARVGSDIAAGEISFQANTSGAGAGVFTSRTGPFELVFLAGTQPTAVPAGATAAPQLVRYRGGTVGFSAALSGAGFDASLDEGVWLDRTGTLEPVVVAGSPVSGLPVGFAFDGNAPSAFQGTVSGFDFTPAGEVAFSAAFSGPGVSGLDDEGVWAGPVGSPVLLAREGDAAPGLTGATFGLATGFTPFGAQAPGEVQINSAGDVLFGARLSGGAFTDAYSIWSTRSGSLEPLAVGFGGTLPNLNATNVPELGPFAVLGQLLCAEQNEVGEVLLHAYGIDEGINLPSLWVERGAELRLVAAARRPAPEVPGVNFENVTPIGLGDDGVVWFCGWLQSVGFATAKCLYAANPGETPRLVMRVGFPVDLFGDASDVRILADFRPGLGESSTGARVFELGFTDGSRVIATLDPVLGEFPVYCVGDGGLAPGCTPCPCGNEAAGTGGGCLNSSGGSARLRASGLPSLSVDTLRVEVDEATPQTFAVLVSADNALPNNPQNPCFGLDTGVLTPLFDGLRCIGGNLLRHGARPSDATGSIGVTTPGWGGGDAPAEGLAVSAGFAAGVTREWQVFYRDDPTLGCQSGQNTTPAVSLTVIP